MASLSLSFAVGVLGNVISVLVFASPIKTFWQVVKKKSTENYKVAPYITTLLSTSLWTFYGFLKPGATLVVTVNGAGAVFQFIYVTLFIVYAPKDKKIQTAKLVAVLDVGFLSAVVGVTLALHESSRLTFLGFVAAALTICMYASPLAVIKTVVVTGSVEYMPFLLSFFLFLNGGIWSTYSVLVRDYYIGIPNTIGFVMGLLQLVIYMMYKNNKAVIPAKTTTQDMSEHGYLKLAVKRDDIEMQSHETGVQTSLSNGQTKGKALRKGKSLPKPNITRQKSVRKIIKTLSVGAYNLPSGWTKVDALDLHDDDGVKTDSRRPNPNKTKACQFH